MSVNVMSCPGAAYGLRQIPSSAEGYLSVHLTRWLERTLLSCGRGVLGAPLLCTHRTVGDVMHQTVGPRPSNIMSDADVFQHMRTHNQANALLADWAYDNCWRFNEMLVCSLDALSRQGMGNVAVVHSIRPPRWH